jgi:GxxExxY protein
MWPTLTEIDRLTERIIGCAIEVHKTFGAGLLESMYRECLVIEMKRARLNFESERAVKLSYKSVPIDSTLRIDLLVEGLIVVELKAVETVHPVHQSQVITYLTLTGSPSGLLLNFNVTAMRLGVRRLHHPELYKQQKPDFSS